MIAKIKQFVSSIQFRLSDLFLLIGFIPMVVFLLFGQVFMQYPDPSDVGLPLEAIIPLFLILVISWSIYIYLEYKRGNRVNKFINIAFIVIGVIGIIGIATQPSHFFIEFPKMDGEIVQVEVDLSNTHYTFFTFDLLSIILFIYIGLFIFPRRFKTLNVVYALGYILFALCVILIIYSYIAEQNEYKDFIEAIRIFDEKAAKLVAMKSFIINSNAYGMTLMIGIIFCLIFHATKHKWWYYLIALFFYINMLFSLCRASLFISLIIVIFYTYFDLIYHFKTHKKNIISLIIITSILVLGAGIVLISFLTKGIVIPQLYSFINTFSIPKTFSAREEIWNNTYIMVSKSLPLSFFFGEGFGLLNTRLLWVNLTNNKFTRLTFPTHNAYLNLFAEGGIFYLLAYLALLGYVLYLFIKSYKKQAPLALTLAFGTLVFSIYSLFETIHYLVYPFMFLIILFYNINYKKD